MAAETRAETPAERVTAHLRRWHWSREFAVHLSTLAQELGMVERDVQTYVREARDAGAPICSSSCGLWYSTEDARQTAYGLILRGANVIRGGRAMLAASALPGQDPLFDCPPEILQALAEAGEDVPAQLRMVG
jgi:hypothetical protein